MHIVIPGALPPAPVAPELARRLPGLAPTLLSCLQAGSARTQPMDTHALGCTPYEAWLLQRAGFQPRPGQLLGAGLGPLRAGPADAQHAEPVWLADLAHLAVGTDRATLADPDALGLSAEEDRALFAAAEPWFKDTGFTARPLALGRWRMDLPAGLAPPSASPAAVAADALHDWWPQDAATRPWRRLMNEIQMVWHDHPVNVARTERGALPVNGLWLYGGGRPWTVPAVQDTHLVQVDAAHRAGDWAAWLQALPALDQALDRALDPARRQSGRGRASLVLTGADRLVTLAYKSRGPLLAWLPSPKKNWNTWWSLPV